VKVAAIPGIPVIQIEEFLQCKARKPGRQAAQRVKKYPNRRLYDTDTSTYITLADAPAGDGQRVFVVRDAKTNEDLTRSILLQIILEEEAGGADVHRGRAGQIIRFYGHAMQGFMGSYLGEEHPGLHRHAGQLAQSKSLTPEMWAQFMSMQSPVLQGLMGGTRSSPSRCSRRCRSRCRSRPSRCWGFGLKR
jgi:polyhydroxyalkanoate synthesis repressor PhaR